MIDGEYPLDPKGLAYIKKVLEGRPDLSTHLAIENDGRSLRVMQATYAGHSGQFFIECFISLRFSNMLVSLSNVCNLDILGFSIWVEAMKAWKEA